MARDSVVRSMRMSQPSAASGPQITACFHSLSLPRSRTIGSAARRRPLAHETTQQNSAPCGRCMVFQLSQK